MHERLETLERGRFAPSSLLAMATLDGYRSLGWDGGLIAAGQLADLVAVRLDSPRTAGVSPAQVLYAATSADVTDTVVHGEHVVRDGVHRSGRRGPDAHRRHRGGPAVTAGPIGAGARSTLVTNIGELVTCAGPDGGTPVLGAPVAADERLGIVREAAVVIEEGRVVWVGPAARAPIADRRVDVGGAAVVPGFVDSHSHLVYAGRPVGRVHRADGGHALRRGRHRGLGGRHACGVGRRAAGAPASPGSPRCVLSERRPSR